MGDLNFAGKKVLVTGGSRGIGWAIVDAFLRRGASVASLDVQTGEPAMPAQGATYLAVEGDVADGEQVAQAVTTVRAKLGGLDVLVNNAGINRDRVIWKMSEAEWDEVIAVDLKGCFHTIRAAAPIFREQNGGRIINISSINGLRGKFGQTNYSAAKAGVIGLTKAAARELGAFGVTVNAICPGLVLTDMVRAAPARIIDEAKAEMVLPEPPQPEDVAGAVLFLASDLARRITGEVIRVDSGQWI